MASDTISLDGFEEVEETRDAGHFRMLERPSGFAGELSTNRLVTVT